ncbi:FAD-dependent oxidoreductase [Pantoea cypripedii]|uniref:Pyridine nucleotide-disulfide oxidoreductase n=1 Tax=Pantoea cypripedii TaxID=55209 RepID=A0A1X1ERL3_PANCY|nr:FAD-dependent oxidoreductase [Pantoea cypripedii]MBP2196655.1 NADPH-dependent 2,4-dienoyl-CoA reductase/sulfur reductase-like enzyme/nitrite reductase/ring-hydroxylating ferredoxin subunit [Pantoea cypripedii]ORM92631.1 pyridine nucleotide-disulfide oxidoreductase [Pantoea cypripedii]
MSYQSVVELKALRQHKPTKFSVGEKDILLIREGERVHALQAKCPHAGAPLEQGAVCGGELVCPWHKAVFGIEDGRMHEPLALADLKNYPVRIEQGKVWVDTKPMSAASLPAVERETPVCVVLGSGAAGSAALWTLRHEGFKGHLVLVEREAEAPYDRTALSKFVPSGKMAIEDVPRLLKSDVLSHVERIQANVVELNSAEQLLIFADGNKLHFDQLLIASGGTPQPLAIPGHDLPGVHLLRSLNQASSLLDDVDETHQIVIIGNSFIGMELAGALRNRDIDVTVLARHPLPFAKQFGEEIGQHFRDLHTSNGVKMIVGEPQALVGNGKVEAVMLKNGKSLTASLVLFATGIKPVTGFVHDLAMQSDGSLTTDSQLQVAKNIWAAGDIASYPTQQGPLRIEHYRVAHQQGRIAALNMLGQRELYDRVPFFWTAHYGTRYEYLGHATEWDEFHLLGSLPEKRFIAFYGQQGRLAAVCSAGMYTLTAALVEHMQQPMTVAQGIALFEDYQG